MRPWLVKIFVTIVPQWYHLESDFDVEIREVLSLHCNLPSILPAPRPAWSNSWRLSTRSDQIFTTSLVNGSLDETLHPTSLLEADRNDPCSEVTRIAQHLDVARCSCRGMSCHVMSFYVVMTCYVTYVMLCSVMSCDGMLWQVMLWYTMSCYGMVVLCCFPWFSMDVKLCSHVFPWFSNCFPMVSLFIFWVPNGFPMVVPCFFEMVCPWLSKFCSNGFLCFPMVVPWFPNDVLCFSNDFSNGFLRSSSFPCNLHQLSLTPRFC